MLYGIFGCFRFGWDFPTELDLGDVDPLTLNFNTLDTQKAHHCAKPNFSSHGMSISVANCGM